MANPPVLVKPIPAKVVNEGAAFSPFDLNNFIQAPDGESGEIIFTAEQTSGASLPKGLICTHSGIVSGIPAANTQGVYEILITAQNDADVPLTVEFKLTIKERIAMDPNFLGELKARVWEAVGSDLPIPELGDILNRPITAAEIYYLLQRWATITIWDVYNLDAPSEKKLLDLKDCSPHYHIYDRGSCLIAAPKDLFSYDRTLEDGLQTARVLAQEVFKRGWVIEFAGFDKLVRAAWVELQLLGEQHRKTVEILHYEPSVEDLKIFQAKSKGPATRMSPE
jgi:hypothetical protein